MTYPRSEPKDEEYGAYQDWLHTSLWPASVKAGEELKDVAEMAPQHAAAALAKLVRWARYAPAGQVALLPDEDSREDEVRVCPLGSALAARACNLDPDHFYGLYGEYGSAIDADFHEVLAEMAVTLGDEGLEDWQLRDRLVLSAKVIAALGTRFRIVNRKD